MWFKKHHSEKVPSAVERYTKEVGRVSGVLDGYLAQQKQEHGGSDGPWLVGNKFSYADIAFIPWQAAVTVNLDKDEHNEDDFPHVKEWLSRMISRESAKIVFKDAQPPK